MAMLDYYLSSLPDDKAELSVVTSGGATGDDDSSFSRELDQRRAMELDSLDMQHDKQNYNMQSAARNSMIKRLTLQARKSSSNRLFGHMRASKVTAMPSRMSEDHPTAILNQSHASADTIEDAMANQVEEKKTSSSHVFEFGTIEERTESFMAKSMPRAFLAQIKDVSFNHHGPTVANRFSEEDIIVGETYLSGVL